MFSIGEFSKITGLSIKALRLYHEQGILVPSAISQDSNYRYYDQVNVDRTRAIALLRRMMFSLDDIKEILKQSEDDADTISFSSGQPCSDRGQNTEFPCWIVGARQESDGSCGPGF